MDYIYTDLTQDSFLLDWKFTVKEKDVYTIAVFDTGCMESLISINRILTEITKEKKRALKTRDIKSKSVTLQIGRGMESHSDDKNDELDKIKVLIDKRNKYIGSLSDDEIQQLVDCEYIVCKHKIKNATLAGYKLMQDTYIHISYDFDNIALIGMDIIKRMNVLITSKYGSTLLFAKYDFIDSLQQLLDAAELRFNVLRIMFDEPDYIDFYSMQTLQANHVHVNEINKQVNESKNELYLKISERFIISQLSDTKQTDKDKIIKYLTKQLLIPEDIAKRAYNNIINRLKNQ